MRCIVCDHISSKIRMVMHNSDSYNIYKCHNCELEYVYPMPTYKQLDIFYSNYEDIRAKADILIANSERNRQLIGKYGVTGDCKLLDFGSGKNIFIQSSNNNNWFSYDPYTDNNDINTLRFNTYHCVTAWGVLEHVVDPNFMIRNVASYLQSDGLFIATTVDIDRVIPFQYKPPEHLTYWTKKSASILFENNNMRLIDYTDYIMVQDREVYMSIIMRNMPEIYKSCIEFEALPKHVIVPTNEVFIVAKKL